MERRLEPDPPDNDEPASASPPDDQPGHRAYALDIYIESEGSHALRIDVDRATARHLPPEDGNPGGLNCQTQQTNALIAPSIAFGAYFGSNETAVTTVWATAILATISVATYLFGRRTPG